MRRLANDWEHCATVRLLRTAVGSDCRTGVRRLQEKRIAGDVVKLREGE